MGCVVMLGTYGDNLYTVNQIAEITGKALSTIRRNKKINEYLDGFGDPDNTGRRARVYKPSVIEIWGKSTEEISNPTPETANFNKRRADCGVPRGWDDEKLWYRAVKTCKECYLSMPTKNLSEACRMTVNIAKLNGDDLDYDKFKSRMDRNRNKSNKWRSPYFAENWRALHDTVFKYKKNAVDNHPFTAYDMFGMFKKEGLLDKGFGSRRVIVVDDFKRDVWVDDGEEMKMPWGLLFIDGITNYPLMCIPADSINTDTVAAGVLMTAFAHGINEDTIWVFETSRAMNNPNVRNLLKSLYSPEQLEAFKLKSHWSKQLFPGQTGPYINSPSQIAQSIFKSKVERSIRNFKDEFDGVYFPTSYQGGDRKEGVQLSLSGSPLDILSQSKPGQETELPHSKKLIPINEFWTRFHNWIWGKYINVPRANMYNGFRHNFGIKNRPSIKEVHDYFTSDSDGSFKPDMNNLERFALVLYYAQSERHRYTVKVDRIGQYSTIIDGRQLNLRCKDMNESHVGLKVCTIPSPFDPDQFVVIEVTNPNSPEFVGIANNRIASTFEQAREFQQEAQQMRESNTARMKADADAHYVTLGDDFEFESTPPVVEQWTNDLAAKQSKLIESSTKSDDSDEEIIDVEEYEFTSPKMKELKERLGDDF